MDDIRSGILTNSKASICGVEFTADQDLAGDDYQTCGSVITCVINGQSMYGKVLKFFSHICRENDGLYTYVQWMNKTDYPFEGTPLVVRVCDNAQTFQPTVMSIFDIDPSRVIIERCDIESCYYVCRIEGLDTVKE